MRRGVSIALAGTLVACTAAPPAQTPGGATIGAVSVKRTPQLAELTGKVKAPATLISDHGAGVVSNNGAGVVSNQGALVIGNNTGGYRLAATAWVPVARRPVVLTDAKGKTVAGPVTTDAAGAFRFPGVEADKTWVVRAELGVGRTLEALARTGTAAEVTPASTVALAVARARVPDVATADAAAVGRLAAALAPVLLADETLLDLAAPLATFTRAAALRPAVETAAAALEAPTTPARPSASATPPAGARPQPSASAKPAGTPAPPGASPSPAPSAPPAPGAATPWAVLPEIPVGLAAHGERTFVVLTSEKSIRVDTTPAMPEVAKLAFTPSLTMAQGASLFVFDRAAGKFHRFQLGGTAEAPTCVEADARDFGILPAPALTAGAVDATGNILAAATAATLLIPVSQGEPVAQLVAPNKLSFTGLVGGLKAAVADGGGWFWVGTGEAQDNLFRFEIANIPDRPQPTGKRFTVPAPIRDLATTGEGGLLIATRQKTGGLFAFDGGVVKQLAAPDAVDRVAVTASGAIRALSGSNLHRL